MKFSAIFVVLATVAATNARALYARANNQAFTGALGGIAATPVEDSGDAKRPFQVKGDTFVNLAAALQRSCDQQFNACANAANAGGVAFSSADCQAQKTQCSAAN
ncbi:hypothetical protein BCR34DRAFT_629077 [Clohesyomyces aquaticus]|uniref:Uncharacterized protein n=1 Tax=Clohesyomyces aquaticus TaxID=1231657 RepID=A0A1Y1YAZ8_9PLEO|nr:hypothetical protein BCR34DRAFT_629077 [Clohesyomyces aquaticus]